MKRPFSIIMTSCLSAAMIAGCGAAGTPGEDPSQAVAGATGSESGWVALLDGGQGFDGWERLGNANWRVVDGVVQADSKEGTPAGFLVTPRSYGNFELHVEFWVSDDANSGIYMRCADALKMSDVTCYEANIFDQRPEAAYGTGAIVHHAPVDPMPKAGGQWNSYDIVANGPRLTVRLNGVETASMTDSSLASGPIALQYAAGVVRFRKVMIRELD